MRTADPHAPTKEKLIAAGIKLMLAKGFNATTVDAIIAEARATKSSFFHFFKSKDDLGKAALESYAREQQDGLRSSVSGKTKAPAARALDQIDALIAIMRDPAAPRSCLVGNFSQELASTRPDMRALCARQFALMSEGFERALADAGVVRAERVSNLFMSVFEGSLLLGKAKNDPSIVVENLRQFRSYVESLIGSGKSPGGGK